VAVAVKVDVEVHVAVTLGVGVGVDVRVGVEVALGGTGVLVISVVAWSRIDPPAPLSPDTLTSAKAIRTGISIPNMSRKR
jgi:hypothetical protein